MHGESEVPTAMTLDMSSTSAGKVSEKVFWLLRRFFHDVYEVVGEKCQQRGRVDLGCRQGLKLQLKRELDTAAVAAVVGTAPGVRTGLLGEEDS